MKINCIIVTYNRQVLLEECVNSVSNQTYPINKIIIVNNNSTDSTSEYLAKFANDERYKIINLDENIGGSGGFNIGLKESISLGCDWSWMMDDDTIPLNNTLENLVNKTDLVKNIGFLVSKVLWTNGDVHLMNIACPVALINNTAYNQFSEKSILLVPSASFVSFFVSSKAVKQVGLPIKEFFIWGDDVEYSKRIIEYGYFGAYVNDSIVYHKTNDNYSTSLLSASVNMKWKFFYKFRNGIFQIKKSNSVISFLAKTIVTVLADFITIMMRKNGKWIYFLVLLKGSLAGIFFNPKIEKI